MLLGTNTRKDVNLEMKKRKIKKNFLEEKRRGKVTKNSNCAVLMVLFSARMNGKTNVKKERKREERVPLSFIFPTGKDDWH